MTERDPAAVRVHIARLPSFLEARVCEELEDHRCERLVDLDHRHVVPGEARLLESALAGLRVAVEHAVRVDAGKPEGDETRPRLEPESPGGALRGDEHRRSPVADLTRAARGDDAVGLEGRGELCELLERRVAARRLVDREQRAYVRVRHLDGNDLVLEPPLVDRLDRPAMRLVRVRVERLPRKVPLVREHLGRDPLRHDLPALEELLREPGESVGAEVRAHGNSRHVLDACGDDDVEMAGLNRRRAVESRLHRRSALAVCGGSADGFGPAGDEQRDTSDVERLLTDLADAAHLNVLDRIGLDARAVDESVQHLPRQLVGADARERPVLPADRASYGVDDVGLRHR